VKKNRLNRLKFWKNRHVRFDFGFFFYKSVWLLFFDKNRTKPKITNCTKNGNISGVGFLKLVRTEKQLPFLDHQAWNKTLQDSGKPRNFTVQSVLLKICSNGLSVLSCTKEFKCYQSKNSIVNNNEDDKKKKLITAEETLSLARTMIMVL